MIVLTADQVDSRHQPDLAESALLRLGDLVGDRLARPAERTAGDEIQLATTDADAALTALLTLSQREEWSIGVGIGTVRTPLAETTRAMSGSAFVHARDAVEAAKKRPTRFALRADADVAPAADELEPLLDLLLLLRARRTPEGWELAELLDTGMTQRAAAEQLGITPQAASLRGQSAHLRVDEAARAALTAMLARADQTRHGKDPS
ncbi:DNA-binding protein [uncultured Schumannella sp.]|uniref:DNA-binding protein n=1 Tax=uncultured Schumannella sp. TaxID=1195956 RepID=UPI0025E64008|nr:DNA-binding protein [uncultured Schumannella sp.]